MPDPNQAKLCVADESIIVGMVDREGPIAQARGEWEIDRYGLRHRLSGSGRVRGERAHHMARWSVSARD